MPACRMPRRMEARPAVGKLLCRRRGGLSSLAISAVVGLGVRLAFYVTLMRLSLKKTSTQPQELAQLDN